MSKPPPSGDHSDIDGVYKDARSGVPNRDPFKGTAEDLERARKENVARPDEDEDGSPPPG